MNPPFFKAAGVYIIIPHVTTVEPVDKSPLGEITKSPLGEITKEHGIVIKLVGGDKCVFTFDNRDARDRAVGLVMDAIATYYKERGEKSHGREEGEDPRHPEGEAEGVHRGPAQEEGPAG